MRLRINCPGAFQSVSCGIVRPALTHGHAGFPGLKMVGRGVWLLMNRGQFEPAVAHLLHLPAEPAANKRDCRQRADQAEEPIAARVQARVRFTGARRDALLWEGLLGGDEVKAIPQPVVDQCLRAEFVDQPVKAFRVVLAVVAQAVKPEHSDFAVIGEQLADVAFHVIEILCPLLALRFTGPVFGGRLARVAIPGMMHIGRVNSKNRAACQPGHRLAPARGRCPSRRACW